MITDWIKWLWPFNNRRERCQEAQRLLKRLEDQQEEVTRLSNELSRRREQNNFRRMVEEVMRG